jgi:hypothetical protein
MDPRRGAVVRAIERAPAVLMPVKDVYAPMARHRYRVTQRLPWINGGRPGPNFSWVGGTAVVYEPGDVIVVDDRELPSIAHCLEATDDGGRAVLESVKAEMRAPAKITMVANLHPKDRDWLIRATDENLRRQGRIRDLVVRMLTRGKEPTLDDLASAIQEAPDAPIPMVLVDCVARVLRGLPRRPGPKKPKRTTSADLAICAYYHYELERAQQAHEADSPYARAVADAAKKATATAFGISKRTIERVLALRPSSRKRGPE